MQKVALKLDELPYELNEELKLLRTNILFCGTDKRVILLTSAFSGEGKSTLALNLSQAVAELGKRVILIDTDMRKSVMKHRVVGTFPKTGLSYYLSGQLEMDDVLCETSVPNFDMVFAGAIPPNPTELLSSPNMNKLMDFCKANYDYVIVDSPPVGLVIDAAVVATMCDGILVLIEANEVKYRLAQEVVGKMRATGCPILGVALNKVDYRRTGKNYGKYYGRKYKRYYKYKYRYKYY